MVPRITSTSPTIVEEIRRLYVDLPWTTVFGLAERCGVTPHEAAVAVVGGWTGISGLTVGVVAEHLARARRANLEVIERRLGGQGRVRLEPRIEQFEGQGAVPINLSRRVHKIRPRKSIRLLRLEEHCRSYEPLVGASARRAGERRRTKA